MIEREIGEVGLSIPTSASFEALLTSVEDDIQYDSLWVNIKTLIRNLLSASKIKPNEMNHDDLAYEIVTEVEHIPALMSSVESLANSKLIVYANSYDGLTKRLPKAKIKTPHTDKQITESVLDIRTIDAIKTNLDANLNYDFREGDYILEGGDDRSLILTHCPVDLISVYNFNTLRLLESHTGAIKKQSLWNSKLTGGDANARLPFNLFTLQVFGDNSVHFYGYSYKYKKTILTIASNKDWNSTTSKSKIVKDIEKELPKDNPMRVLFLSILKGKLFF